MSSTPPALGAVSGVRPSNGTSLARRKPKDVDPLFTSKKKTHPRPLSKSLANGYLAGNVTSLSTRSPNPTRSVSPIKEPPAPQAELSGFSDPALASGNYQDYKLVTTRRELLQGYRFHLLQFAGDKPVDVRNEADFTRPVRLHRRDVRGSTQAQARDEVEDFKDGLDKADREELNVRKEARQKEREANLALIAPSANASKKMGAFKKKTQQVYRPGYTEEDRKRIQNNYEEKLPWHLEDFDNKHCFVGSNQAGSTNVHAAFVYEPSVDSTTGKFRLLPVEKTYTFKSKQNTVKTMTIEEAEAAMHKRGRAPEWLIRQAEARQIERSRELESKKAKGLFSGVQKEHIAGRQGEEADFDFDEDFADDEEGDLFQEKDEDEKLAEKRIKEDQLQANFLDFKDEKDYDKAEEKEKQEAEAKRKIGKGIKKALELREKNYNHGSDSEDSSGSSEDSEEERQRLEEEKTVNREREEAERKSGISSNGTNTPTGRKEKHGGISSDRESGMKKSGSSKSLKRPGSPNLSEASGTDVSTRKKKKHRHLSSTQPTPQPSRPHSPVNVPPPSSAPTGDVSKAQIKKRKSMLPGAGSDTETALYSDGGAMSENSMVTKRLKLNPPALISGSATTVRSGSGAATPRQPKSPPQGPVQVGFPTAQEIIEAISAGGMSTKDLLAKFRIRVGDRQSDFIMLMKTVARLDKGTKLLIPITARPSVPGTNGSVEVKKEES